MSERQEVKYTTNRRHSKEKIRDKNRVNKI